MLDQLHNDDFPFNTQSQLVLLLAHLPQTHPRIGKELSRYDLDSSLLTCLVVLCDANAAASSLPNELTQLPWPDIGRVFVVLFLLTLETRLWLVGLRLLLLLLLRLLRLMLLLLRLLLGLLRRRSWRLSGGVCTRCLS